MSGRTTGGQANGREDGRMDKRTGGRIIARTDGRAAGGRPRERAIATADGRANMATGPATEAEKTGKNEVRKSS